MILYNFFFVTLTISFLFAFSPNLISVGSILITSTKSELVFILNFLLLKCAYNSSTLSVSLIAKHFPLFHYIITGLPWYSKKGYTGRRLAIGALLNRLIEFLKHFVYIPPNSSKYHESGV